MSFFRWLQGQFSPGHTLPLDIVSMMERFGRIEFDSQGSGENIAAIWSEMGGLRSFATEDPEGFLAALAEAVLPIGDWAVFGAGRTIWDFLSPNRNSSILQHPAYNAIMNASLEFLRTIGGSQEHVTGYEWQHWVANGGTHETW